MALGWEVVVETEERGKRRAVKRTPRAGLWECYPGVLVLSAFSVPGTVLGPGIMETNKAGTEHLLNSLVFADVLLFLCVSGGTSQPL